MSAKKIPLSLLDLVRVRQGHTPVDALAEAQQIASHVDALGFKRYWVAEHHNFSGIASAATSVVLAHVGQHTKNIRLGAGGIMLPNHAPYMIAEQFGTLAAIYPDRVDLGLGRAPGTDSRTLGALRIPKGAAENFANDVQELMHWFNADAQPLDLKAWPATGDDAQMWLLGSSLYGATLAAELGLPYTFASHFAPALLDQALDAYRSRFKPSRFLKRPHAMISVPVVAAQTTDEAKRLFTSMQMAYSDVIRGESKPLQPPASLSNYWRPSELSIVERMLSIAVVGNPEEVREGLIALQRQTDIDEFMLSTDIYDINARRNSLSLTAQVWNA
ncbi:LLM class flavin-dependent oxidoreductase [Pseudomonas sp. AMR01]|uniref:LLM class flavin-dependent oxidoreductase n=1 Tax=Pseudomonas sp. AMR01 TaxID=3064904 RepID=UPI0035C19244